MERAAIKAILIDEDMTVEEKLEQIMRINGADITREKDASAQMRNELDAEREKNIRYADRDAIAEERDALRVEKKERDAQIRFDQVSNLGKFKNEFTRQGLLKLFGEAIERPENRERTDADIMKAIVKGHESEYFESSYRISMTPHSPYAKAPSEIDEIIATKYKNNPWIK